jgi:hypothetical protein
VLEETSIAIAFHVRQRGLLLHRQVRVALVEKDILEDVIGHSQRLIDVAELVRMIAMDVALLAVVVDAGFGVGQRVFRIVDRHQRPIADLDQAHGRIRGLLVHGDHRGDRIADMAHMIGQRKLVDRHWHDAEWHREILAGQYQVHARMPGRRRKVHFLDDGMRMRRAQQLAVQHAGQRQVIGEPSLARHFGAAVDSATRLAHHLQGRLAHLLSARNAAQLLDRFRDLQVAGAAHRLPAVASRISSRWDRIAVQQRLGRHDDAGVQ